MYVDMGSFWISLGLRDSSSLDACNRSWDPRKNTVVNKVGCSKNHSPICSN